MTATEEKYKAELEAVLQSDLFAHAPSLAQFLSYICTRFFDGQVSAIKEYCIAVEALGRPPDFDQKKDSIVRVEAHRLRKRLSQYYEGEGASHSLQIVIPAGQYVPQFVMREEAQAAREAEGGVEPAEPVNGAAVTLAPVEPMPSQPVPRTSRWLWLSVAGVILFAGLIVWRVGPSLASPPRKTDVAVVPPVPGSEDQEVRILVGSNTAKYVDRFGSIWGGDRFFQGGSVFTTSPGGHIVGTQDPMLFQSRREGSFRYDIPLKPGMYELHLYFAETLFGDGNLAGGGETFRLFDIVANGKTLTSQLDIVADAPGPNMADIKVYKDISPGPDGFLHLEFPPTTKEKAFLNAIEILPGIPGKLRPVRIVARETSQVSKDGVLWGADRYFVGGQRVLRSDSITGTTDPELYMGERFGNFRYSIPAAPGKYMVKLRFCETWFGPRKPAGGGGGLRLFDVYSNGVALLRNFDIFTEAGGEDIALEKVFHSIQPNAQGKIVLSFVPVRNYACVNAIEVVDESQ